MNHMLLTATVRQTSSVSYAPEQLSKTYNDLRTFSKQYLTTHLTSAGEPIPTKREESRLMDHTRRALPVPGEETSNTRPSHVAGKGPGASDKGRRDTSVTKGEGQATPRCQATVPVRQTQAAVTSSCHASLKGGGGWLRVGWHKRENKMK